MMPLFVKLMCVACEAYAFDYDARTHTHTHHIRVSPISVFYMLFSIEFFSLSLSISHSIFHIYIFSACVFWGGFHVRLLN